MTDNENGRIKLSWAQIVWAVATLAAVIGSWADTRTQIALGRQELALRAAVDLQTHAELKAEDQRLWGAVREAQAATTTKASQRK